VTKLIDNDGYNPRWLSPEEIRLIAQILKPTTYRDIICDVFGNWYHFDESGAEVRGPFLSLRAVEQAMLDYAESL
jgi:hypothetical protein